VWFSGRVASSSVRCGRLPMAPTITRLRPNDLARGSETGALGAGSGSGPLAASLRSGALAVSNLPPRLLFRGPSTRTKMRHTQSLRKSEQRRRLFAETFALSPMLARGRKASSANDQRPDWLPRAARPQE
jgi:hypothetical protein